MGTIDTLLKIAGVKDIESFYKKFPSEEAFMAKYGVEFKKAMKGAKIQKAQDGFNMSNKLNANMNDWFNVQNAGLSQEDQLKLNPLQTWNFPKQEFMSGKSLPIKPNNINKGLSMVGDVVKGFQMLKDEKNKMQEAQQWRDVSNVQLQASNLQPERINNRYLRPEDNPITGEQYFPTYGTGSNVLAKKGAKIKAKSGAGVPWGDVGNTTSNILEGIMGEDGGGTIGGAVGKTAGTLIGGPIGGAIGQVGGQVIGSLLDTRPERTKGYLNQAGRNASLMMANAGVQGIHDIYSGYMEDGGKITGMETDGELQMLENKGDIKSLSYNPFLPDGGETVQFEGDSHAQGGMNIAFGNTPVEVEGGEPATKMDDDSLVVYGNLPAPGYKGKKFKNVAKYISKKEEKQSELIRIESKKLERFDVQNPFDKLELETHKLNIRGATMKQKELAQEKEHLASLQEAINQAADEQNLDASALAKGKIKKAKKSDRNMAQDGKTVPDSLYKAYGFQPVTNPTQMSEAIMEMQNRQNAVFGYPPQIPQSYTPYPDTPVSNVNQQNGQDWEPLPELLPIIRPDVEEPIISTKTGTGKGTGTTKSSTVEATNEYQPVDRIEPLSGTPQVGSTMMDTKGVVKEEMDKLAERINQTKKGKGIKGEDLWNTLSSLIPYFKPSDVEGLDPSQIAGELAALSDREEPVWAQTLQPDLASPYEISLQDQKNEVIASSRAAQRMTGNNPAAQAMIASQTSDALNKIQGEEFRINQGMKDKVFTENRNLMNQTRFQNLEILDKLYERQSMAKSKTKDTLRNALNSISDKYLKNRFENRTLAMYENLDKYTFDDRGRAWYMGRPASFNMEGGDSGMRDSRGLAEGFEYVYNSRGQVIDVQKTSRTVRKTEKEARNGAIVRALKRI